MNFKGLVLIFFGITVSWMIGSIPPSNAQDKYCSDVFDVPEFNSSTHIQTKLCLIHFDTDQRDPFNTSRTPLHRKILVRNQREAEVTETVNFIRTLHDREDVTIHAIRIEGYADSVESDSLALSRERAERVNSLLRQRLGYRLYDIYAHELNYYGPELDSMVVTPPGVDEPANRRVEVTIFFSEEIYTPLPPTHHVIYFDSDKTTLNYIGRREFSAAVDAAVDAIRDLHKRQDVTIRAIRIEGHADTMESDSFALSRRRAETVDSLLWERLGYRLYNTYKPTVDYFGESVLVVPTADGIDEPANRRVEIILEFSR